MIKIEAGLQKGIAQRAADQRASRANGFRSTHRLQAGVDFDKIHRNQVSSLVNTLADEVAFSECQSPTHWGTSARRPLRVQSINIEGQMDGSIISNMSQRHLNHTTDSMTRETLLVHVLGDPGKPV